MNMAIAFVCAVMALAILAPNLVLVLRERRQRARLYRRLDALRVEPALSGPARRAFREAPTRVDMRAEGMR